MTAKEKLFLRADCTLFEPLIERTAVGQARQCIAVSLPADHLMQAGIGYGHSP